MMMMIMMMIVKKKKGIHALDPESAKQTDRSAKVPVDPKTRPSLTFIRLSEAPPSYFFPPASSFFRPPHLPPGRLPRSLSRVLVSWLPQLRILSPSHHDDLLLF